MQYPISILQIELDKQKYLKFCLNNGAKNKKDIDKGQQKQVDEKIKELEEVIDHLTRKVKFKF